jgi:repressor LexA
MPKEIYPSSYACDCGHQLRFFENTILLMRQLSYRKRSGIGEGDDRHAVIFHKGRMVAIFCPKRNAEIPAIPAAVEPAPRLRFTKRQGQVLAFIHMYIKLNRRPPAEIDIARYFQITPPSAHQMVRTLDDKKLIVREPGVGRSIRLLVDPANLPELD